jgi:hypothetical protein
MLAWARASRRETAGSKVASGQGSASREEGFNCTLARELAPTLKRGAVKLSEEDRRQHLSSARKAASAMIAKIPLALSSHIARVYKPKRARSMTGSLTHRLESWRAVLRNGGPDWLVEFAPKAIREIEAMIEAQKQENDRRTQHSDH